MPASAYDQTPKLSSTNCPAGLITTIACITHRAHGYKSPREFIDRSTREDLSGRYAGGKGP